MKEGFTGDYPTLVQVIAWYMPSGAQKETQD